jgi:transcriptional/translational regulatory protein YebC/TACO1
VFSSPGDFERVRDAIAKGGFEAVNAEVSMEPSTTVQLAGDEANSMLRLMDALEDLDDIQNVYANFEISSEEMAKFA